MERTSKQFTISLPPDMAEQVLAVAKAESRTVSELFRETFRTYRVKRIEELFRLSREQAEKSGHNGYGPEDVERLIHEMRTEQDGIPR